MLDMLPQDSVDGILEGINKGISKRSTLQSVTIFVAIFAVLGCFFLIAFLCYRPYNSILYEPKSRQNANIWASRVFRSRFCWITAVFRINFDEIVTHAGTDAAVFLLFLSLAGWILLTISVFLCLILLPIDISYSLKDSSTESRNNDAANNDSNTSDDWLMYATLGRLDGPSVWAHVALSYIATIVALYLVQRFYKQAINLRQKYFDSATYQGSYFSRAVMLTDIKPELRDAQALQRSLNKRGIPYPFVEIQVGHSMNKLPSLLNQHNKIVFKLEHYLNLALSKNRRPTIYINTRIGFGGQKVDAIGHYFNELQTLEREIGEARSDDADGDLQPYGFASLAAPAYAHAVARKFAKRDKSGMVIRMASSPRDIIWSSLSKMKRERIRQRLFGFMLLTLLFFVNMLPLFIAAAISNMNAFTGALGFLGRWQSTSPNTFAAVSGVVPPLITFCFAYMLPMIMRKIAKYQCVRTWQSRDRALLSQYFVFLVLTQFVIFSSISIVLDIVINIRPGKRHTSDASVLSSEILQHVEYRFQSLSGFWMTWIVLKGFLMILRLCRVLPLMAFYLRQFVRSYTPRERKERKQPPYFSYWIEYAEMLLLATVGFIYAPLAPIVTAFAASVFWISNFVYKTEFCFVYATKSETGGRLWTVATKCLLTILGCMQIIVAIVIGLKQSWIKAVSCFPPVLFVVGFALYAQIKLEPAFLWYDPSPLDLAKTKKVIHDADREPLERQFGHPFLHARLAVPIVYAKYFPRVCEFYNGPVASSSSRSDSNTCQIADIELSDMLSMMSDIYSELPKTHEEVTVPEKQETTLGYKVSIDDADSMDMCMMPNLSSKCTTYSDSFTGLRSASKMQLKSPGSQFMGFENTQKKMESNSDHYEHDPLQNKKSPTNLTTMSFSDDPRRNSYTCRGVKDLHYMSHYDDVDLYEAPNVQENDVYTGCKPPKQFTAIPMEEDFYTQDVMSDPVMEDCWNHPNESKPLV